MGDKQHYDRAEIVPRLCALMEQGQSMRKAALAVGVPESTARLWESEDATIAAQYTRAREIGFDAVADETLAIADNTDEDAQSRRVRVDTRKWLLAKQAPKRYGDKMTVAGDAENPVVTVTRIELVAAAVRSDDGADTATAKAG
jgi:hypothetical protein